MFIKQRSNAARLIYPPYGKAIQKLVYSCSYAEQRGQRPFYAR